MASKAAVRCMSATMSTNLVAKCKELDISGVLTHDHNIYIVIMSQNSRDISSIIRTEETSLVGFKMAWPSGHGRFITVHTSLLTALPLIHLDEMEGAATVNSNSAIAYLTTNNEMVSLALFYLFKE